MRSKRLGKIALEIFDAFSKQLFPEQAQKIDSLCSPICEQELAGKGNRKSKRLAVLKENRLCRIASPCSPTSTKIAANGDRRTKRVGPFAGEVFV